MKSASPSEPRPLGSVHDELRPGSCTLGSLSQNHPFIDGNKRAAVTVAAAFLKVNGYRLGFVDETAYRFLIRLYEEGRMRFRELEARPRAHAV